MEHNNENKKKKKPNSLPQESVDNHSISPAGVGPRQSQSGTSDFIPDTELKETGKKICKKLGDQELCELFKRYVKTIKRKNLDETQLW